MAHLCQYQKGKFAFKYYTRAVFIEIPIKNAGSPVFEGYFLGYFKQGIGKIMYADCTYNQEFKYDNSQNG